MSYDDERADRACAELTKFGDHYVNADFPDWYYQIAVAGRMVALLKKETAEGEEPEARPIGCGNIVRRLIHGVLANDFAGPAAKAHSHRTKWRLVRRGHRTSFALGCEN